MINGFLCEIFYLYCQCLTSSIFIYLFFFSSCLPFKDLVNYLIISNPNGLTLGSVIHFVRLTSTLWS